MIPMTGLPCLKENSTIQNNSTTADRVVCPIGSSGPCGFNELMVVNDKGGLVGRVTQQGIFESFFLLCSILPALKPLRKNPGIQ